jgi:cell division protein ZapA
LAENLVEVQILGRKILLTHDGNEDYAREIAEFVNDKMERVQAESKSTTTLNVAILTALDIADDYFKQIGRHREVCEKIDKQCLDLVNFIDSKL